MRRLALIVPALAITIAAVACSSSGGATGSTGPTDSTLTYENFGKAFREANCTKCHSASGRGESPLLDSVTAIRAASSEIDKEAAAGPDATNTSMPEDGDVAESERKKLGEWLACGAP